MNFEDKIAKLCLEKYASLKKTGKPRENEWTVLSGIVLKNHDELSVVSLATGTKCLGANELMDNKLYDFGSRLNDSHGEVLTRRAFIRYLYGQVHQLLSCGKSDVFFFKDNDNKWLELKNGVSFHFYCSQSPCGDCSIIPKSEIDDTDQECSPFNRIKLNDNLKNDENRIIIDDIHRTGAKCVKTELKQDLHFPGEDYHVIGPLRTKPGRGDPTLSLSCSDKLAKWNLLGIQGALLSLLVSAMKLESIVIGNGCPFSLEVMERGLCRRFGDKYPLPRILRSSLVFRELKNAQRLNPCPSSIIWCAVKKRDTEIAVEGRKQGATKNKKGRNLLISRRAFLESFLRIIDIHPNFTNLSSHPKNMTYYHYKQWSTEYQKSWKHLRCTVLKAWIEKPIHLQQFSL